MGQIQLKWRTLTFLIILSRISSLTFFYEHNFSPIYFIFVNFKLKLRLYIQNYLTFKEVFISLQIVIRRLSCNRQKMMLISRTSLKSLFVSMQSFYYYWDKYVRNCGNLEGKKRKELAFTWSSSIHLLSFHQESGA